MYKVYPLLTESHLENNIMKYRVDVVRMRIDGILIAYDHLTKVMVIQDKESNDIQCFTHIAPDTGIQNFKNGDYVKVDLQFDYETFKIITGYIFDEENDWKLKHTSLDFNLGTKFESTELVNQVIRRMMYDII